MSRPLAVQALSMLTVLTIYSDIDIIQDSNKFKFVSWDSNFLGANIPGYYGYPVV